MEFKKMEGFIETIDINLDIAKYISKDFFETKDYDISSDNIRLLIKVMKDTFYKMKPKSSKKCSIKFIMVTEDCSKRIDKFPVVISFNKEYMTIDIHRFYRYKIKFHMSSDDRRNHNKLLIETMKEILKNKYGAAFKDKNFPVFFFTYLIKYMLHSATEYGNGKYEKISLKLDLQGSHDTLSIIF